MTDCCSKDSPGSSSPRKKCCPGHGGDCSGVPYKTVLHHISEPWSLQLKDQAWYFCDNADCDVVYFALDDTVINKDRLRTRLGVKDKSDDAPVCYCFGVTRSQALSDSTIREYVVEKTRNKLCDCSTRNPSGRCCLKDFPA